MKKNFLLFVMLSLMSKGFTMVDVDMWDELGNLPEYRYRHDDLRAFEGLGDDTSNPYLELLGERQLEQPQAPQENHQKQPEQSQPAQPQPLPQESGLQNTTPGEQPALAAQVHDVVAAGVVHGALTSRLVSPTPEQQVEQKNLLTVAQIAQVQDVVVAGIAQGAPANRMDPAPHFRLVEGKGLKFTIKSANNQGIKNVLSSVAMREQGTRSQNTKPQAKSKAKKESGGRRKSSVSPQTWIKKFEEEEPENQSLSWLNSSLKNQVIQILEDLKKTGKSTRYAVVQNVI